MKKYIIGLVFLIIVGAALAYLSYEENKALDNDVYLSTTLSIRNLRAIDNDLNIALFNVHYNNQPESTIDALTLQLSEEFDNLRFEALFEEIEAHPELDRAVTRFEKTWLAKLDSIENFIRNYRLLTEVNNAFIQTANNESDIHLIAERLLLEEKINNININFYRYLENNQASNKEKLNDDIASVVNTIEQYATSDQVIIYGYIKTLTDFILFTEETNKHFHLSVQQETGNTLNALASTYVNFHNAAIEKSATLRNALIIYGVILLMLLIIFAFLLRKHYLNLEQQVADRTEEIQQAYTDLKESQEQLIQSEKMASLGEMVAGVAHEINTPLGYVNSNISTIQLNLNDVNKSLSALDSIKKEILSTKRDNKKISSLLMSALKSHSAIQQDEIFDESQQLLDDSAHGLNEISQLVMSLKDFSRLDRQSTDEVDIHHSIENALKIATNHIRENNVVVKKEFSNLPHIVCMPSKLNQLFLNIITNASQAMKLNGGELHIKTHFNDTHIAVAFTDQGIGMDEETVQKMFDPFFTSKPIGEGTGLGMSIAYKIVEAHKGKIQVKSKPNIGTTIAIQLPIQATVE